MFICIVSLNADEISKLTILKTNLCIFRRSGSCISVGVFDFTCLRKPSGVSQQSTARAMQKPIFRSTLAILRCHARSV